MGAWKYRVWAAHGIESDTMEVRATRTAKNVDVDKNGRRIVEFQIEYAWFDRDREGFEWKPTSEGAVIPPFLSISGAEFLTIDQQEGEELLSYLLPYRVDCDRAQGHRLGSDLLPSL